MTKSSIKNPLNATEFAKLAAAKCAVDFVQDGMRLGLGTGSTAAWMVRALADRIAKEGLKVQGVPTSSRTAALAHALNVPIVTLDQAKWLDLTIDGADEFDPQFQLIKGGGAALLQEKIVAQASDQMIVITDPAKDVARLGAFALPVEVIPFGSTTTQRQIEALLADLGLSGRTVTLRQCQGAPLMTDENNFILDLHLQSIPDALALAQGLNAIAGVVENGLFIGLCDRVIIGHPDGRAETRGHEGSLFSTLDPQECGDIFAMAEQGK
ncbi:MAG: ribose 5-phosphate isomerase [Rhodobacter sp. BACL10 MAG-120419-bin15]|jgi:ribose 5-phosphate isomerase A|nr:MAG: ribose 5-phosphate isomerase [Rhodobacter sp. BACL10 MAG-120419-bin15]